MDIPKKTEDMKEYQRLYRLKMKEKINDYSQKYMINYYADNKDRFYENNKKFRLKTTICDCGCEIKTYNISNHKKTQKHINIVNAYNKGKKDKPL